MLIANSIAGFIAATLAGVAVPLGPAPPPIAIAISAAPNVPPTLVDAIVAETEGIFRSARVTFVWRRNNPSLTALRVTIGEEPRASAQEHQVALGWIAFEDNRPDDTIHLSIANANHLLDESVMVVGPTHNMTRAERERFVGRALGRALAHELGHYLLATKAHTSKGLLKAIRTAQDLFGPEAGGFHLEPRQQQQIAARLRGESVVASR
jgi:hypothetical protein